jgi:Lrp/AsnC family leucine-responsive transcriptional regulator
MAVDRTITIDELDCQIARLLQDNARTAQVDIAREVGLAASAVLERIRKLESRGLVQGYAALLDPRAFGQGMLAFVAVRSAEPPGEDRVAKHLARLPEVLEVHHVAGEDCYLLKVRARDAAHVGELLRKRIGRIKGVTSTRTTIVLETVKETPRIPVPDATSVNEVKA